MTVSASQIVGLIEIEAADCRRGAECLQALGPEELTLGDLLAWLTGSAEPAVMDHADRVAVAEPGNRLSGLIAPGPIRLMGADLESLETDLTEATARFRQSLRTGAAESGGDARR